MLEDGVYTLDEAKAPLGYDSAVNADKFTVKKREGQVYIDGECQTVPYA